jgi:hypothetical protein
MPQRIEAEIVILAFGEDSVSLDAKGIGKECVRSSAIMERIEGDADSIIIFNFFAAADVGAKEARILLTDKHHIYVVDIIREVSSGQQLRSLSIVGLSLTEFRDAKFVLVRPRMQIVAEPRRC